MRQNIIIGAALFAAIAVFAAGCGGVENVSDVSELPGQQPVVESLPEVEVKKGCDYDNPPCGNDYNCVNNSCFLKSGCSYDNPPCSASYDCISNTCVLKKGCSFNNPPCSSNSSCISNSCIPLGCKYNNPPCNSSQICQNNKCLQLILSSGGGGY